VTKSYNKNQSLNELLNRKGLTAVTPQNQGNPFQKIKELLEIGCTGRPAHGTLNTQI
jgi:hypothetical protein